jgi:hypothetical protein
MNPEKAFSPPDMTSTASLLLIRPLTLQGQQLLGNRWPEFLRQLRFHLNRTATAEQENGPELLIFSFNHPHPAIASLLTGLQHLRTEMAWPPEQGNLPIRIILDLAPVGGASVTPPLAAGIWDLLQPETLHITSALKFQWDLLMAGRQLFLHSLAPVDPGLFQVTFADQVTPAAWLFTNRELPLMGKHKECFYCGMTQHEPSSCPSKLLDNQLQGLPLVGYLPFADLSAHFPTALTADSGMLDLLLAGITAPQLRQDPLLQVFMSFFDGSRLYQLRFLQQIASSPVTDWAPPSFHEQLPVTNRNLHLGLDCLRVGQLSQAAQILSVETGRQNGNRFCAAVGQAFCSLEGGREKDMEIFLHQAAELAGSEKEKVYIGLLLSRFYDLQGERWKAEQAVNTILSCKRSCQEAIYRRCQLQARSGDSAAAMRQLHSLITGDRELFMAVLMDPMLVPIQPLVEELLSAHYRGVSQKAWESLSRATAEIRELRGWFQAGEKELLEIEEGLTAATEQYARQSIYALLDMDTQAERLYYRCHRLRETSVARLRNKLWQVTAHWQDYQGYWTRYSYQPLFRRFGEELAGLRRKLGEIQLLSRESRGEAHLAATAGVSEVATALAILRPRFTRMVWAKVALDGLRIFGRKLLITELLFAVLGLGLLFLVHFHLAGEQMLTTPRLLKQLASVMIILLAPLLALILTLWELSEAK